MLAVLALVAQAQVAPPVVRIPGRAESQRPGWTEATSPQAIEVQNQATRPEAVASPAPERSTRGGPSVPIGTILAWAGSMTNTPPLPSGWVTCDGQVVADAASPYLGQPVPDLNGAHAEEDGRFLRGAAKSGGIGGSTWHVHGGYLSQKYGTQRSPVPSAIRANHLPPYYNVVWIIRIK